MCIALWMLDRGKWDQAQLHGLFAPTAKTLNAATLSEAYKWLDRAKVEHQFGRRPPLAWAERWKRLGIRTPTKLDSYRGIIICRNGLHVLTGTLHGRSYEAHRGLSLGSLSVDEVTNGPTRESIEFLMERVRCGDGPEACRRTHLHQTRLYGNCPERDSHFLFDFFAALEKSAQLKTGKTDEATESTPYPLLMRGEGDAIYIPSSTFANEKNLGDRYIERLSSSLDVESQQRRIHGLLIRTKAGRAYSGFSRENEYPISYSPDKTLLVACDFNINPAVALFAQELNPGEYPMEFHREGTTYLGVFGEFFHVGGLDAYGLATALVKGDRGTNGNAPLNWLGIAQHRGRVLAYGDATARNRQMSGPNSWTIINEVLRGACSDNEGRSRYAPALPNSNPLVTISVRSLNARFESATGIRALFIDPRCQELIADLNTCVWNQKGVDIQKYGERGGSKMWLRTHLADALRYLVSERYPMGRDRIETSVESILGHMPPLRSSIKAPVML